jgi:hypothetical protein
MRTVLRLEVIKITAAEVGIALPCDGAASNRSFPNVAGTHAHATSSAVAIIAAFIFQIMPGDAAVTG